MDVKGKLVPGQYVTLEDDCDYVVVQTMEEDGRFYLLLSTIKPPMKVRIAELVQNLALQTIKDVPECKRLLAIFKQKHEEETKK